ncbi:MAG: hypothetical protein ACK476_00055 [Fluviicola sp.]
MNKTELIEFLNNRFTDEINEIQADLRLISNDLANDTKSSAGDKFETSREMANQEISKLQSVLAEKKRFVQILQNDAFQSKSTTIQAGSLAQIDETWYFFGLPFGKTTFQDKTVIGIGLTAPFAQAFLQKEKSNQVNFGQKIQTIFEIL